MRFQEPYTIFLRTLPSGRKVYYYQFRLEDGTRSVAKSTGQSILSRAKRYCKRLYDEGLFEATSSIKFSRFADGFFDDGSDYSNWKKACGFDLRFETIRTYKRLLKCQLLPFFGEYELQKINVDVVKKWIVWMTSRWSAKTSNSAQSVLNIILKSAREKNLIKSVPSLGVPLRKTCKRKRVLFTIDELRLLYLSEWKSNAKRKIFLLAAITGMRIGEICGLLSKNVHEGYIFVENTLVRNREVGDTKTGVHRYVPVPKGIGLSADCSETFVFEDDGKPYSTCRIYNAIMGKCSEFGIDAKSRGITTHSLRNFFISYLRGQGVPDAQVKAVVGHADESMTDHYTYWTPEMFSDVVEAQEILFDKITGGPNEN